MIAKVSHFYSISPTEVEFLPYYKLNQLWEMITMIEAQNLLGQLVLFDWPNMDKNKREKAHKKLYKLAYPSTFNKESKELTPETLAKILRG